MTRHTSTVEPKSSRRRGSISQAARTLGVTREHLSRVLNGHRQSRSLTAKYHALQLQAAPHATGPAHAHKQA